MPRCLPVLVVVLACAASPTAAIAAHRPEITHFRFSPASFVRARAGGHHHHRISTIRFRLSHRAKVRVAVARVRGRRRSFVGALTRRRRAGRHGIAFTGVLRHRRLTAGRYRATIVARDRHGRHSWRRATHFRVRPRPRVRRAPMSRVFPSPRTTGVPAGWVPRRTRSSDLVVRRAGAVVHDVLLRDADLIVEAPNVTIRRVDLQGGSITNFNGNPCQGGMRVEDTTIEPPPGSKYSVETEGVIESAGYTARRVKIWRRSEGFRSEEDCGPVRILDSFAKIVIPPGRCDLHADGIQGYGGPHTVVRNTTIDFTEADCGTAPFFIPKNQGNTSADVHHLLVMGGGYPFRLGVPATVSQLAIVNRSWVFGPIDVACGAMRSWDAHIVTITRNYHVARFVRRQRCNTDSGT